MNRWEVAILKAYNANGGCADNQVIYNTVGNFIPLSSDHLKPTVHGGRPAYVHQVRSHITNLQQDGCLKNVSRGHYCITAKGRQRLKP